MAKKRDDGRYRVSLDVATGKDGKRVRKYFYGSTATEAKKKRTEYIQIHSFPCGKTVDHTADARCMRLPENGNLQSASNDT